MEIMKKFRDAAARFVVKKAVRKVIGGGVAEAVFLPFDLYDAYRTAAQAYEQKYIPFSEQRAWVEARSRLDALSRYLDTYLSLREHRPQEVGGTYGFSPDETGKNLLYYAHKAKKEIASTSYHHKERLCSSLEDVIAEIEEGAQHPLMPKGLKGRLQQVKEKVLPNYEFPIILEYDTCALMLERVKEVQTIIDANLEAFKLVGEHQ